MSDFRKISDSVWASPQIRVEDIAKANEMGITLIVNNRPEGESEDQTAGDDIAAQARTAGLDYIAIPITHAGFNADQISAMVSALQKAQGSVLAYCRSGTRSTLLWALAQASEGANPDEIAAAAMAAGYDITPVRPAVDLLASQRGA